MMNISEQLTTIKSKYHAETGWDYFSDLLADVRKLTGAGGLSEDNMCKGVFLYGAGSIGAGALDYFKQQGINVLGFLDDTPGREGTRFCGLDVSQYNSTLHSRFPIVISMKKWHYPAEQLSESEAALSG